MWQHHHFLGRTLMTTFFQRLRILALAMPSLCTANALGQQPVSVSRIVGLEYPWFAQLAVLQGSVELQATISREGAVKYVRVVSGPNPLSDAAAKSLSRWALKGCRADECTTSVVSRLSSTAPATLAQTVRRRSRLTCLTRSQSQPRASTPSSIEAKTEGSVLAGSEQNRTAAVP
jgi:hypothetical protein